MTDHAPLAELLTALADDELILGHRDSEWTGYGPILEEDIAFSNVAQDEIGHSLVWYSILQSLNGRTPDSMAFERPAREFRCCRFVSYPKGDFAYTVVRQYLFDEAEQARLTTLLDSSEPRLKDAAARLLVEEAYHLLHSKGLVERLGTATTESHARMQAAVDQAMTQALGLFEPLAHEEELISSGIMPGNRAWLQEWTGRVLPGLTTSGLTVPAGSDGRITATPDFGGRAGRHTEHLEQAVADMQSVFRSEAGALW